MRITSIKRKEVKIRVIRADYLYNGFLLKINNHPIDHVITYQPDYPD